MIIEQLAIGFVMLLLTVVVHAVGIDILIRLSPRLRDPISQKFKHSWQVIMTSIIVMGIYGIHIIVIWMWAGLYLVYECAPIASLSDALYFSISSYTTLGLGDIILSESCRILSGVEAANGFILFGWTTAFIFAVVNGLYKREEKQLE